MAIRSLNADCNISDQSIRKGAFLSASTEFSVRTPGVPDTGGTITGARLQITFFDSSGAFMCAFEGKSVIVDGVETSPSYIDVSSTATDPDTYYITLERIPIPNTTLTKGDIQTLLDVYGFTNLKTQADVAASFTRSDTGVVFTTNATGSATFSTSIASSLRVGEQIAISNTTSGTNDGTFTIASIDTTTGVVTFNEATTSQTTNLDIDLVSRYLTTFNGGASSTFTNIAHSIAVDLIWTSTVQGDIVETRNTMLNRGQRVAPYSVPPNTFGGSTRKEIVLSSSRPYFVKELDGTITPSSLTVYAQLIGLEGPISWTTTNNAGTISSDTLSITFNNTTDLSSLPADNTLSVQAQVGEITELYYVTLLEAAINEKFVTAYAKGTSAPTRNASTGTYANPLSGQTADWSLTIPTLADGENLYTITRTFYSDNSASPDWSAATLFFQYVEGFAGKTVTATAPTQVFEYDGLGNIIGTPSTTVTANSFGFTSPEFRFAEGAAPTGAWGGATYSYDPANVYTNMPETIYVEAREVGGSAPEATDTITMSGLLPNQYTVILENEAHTVPANSAGTVSSFVGSGTVVRVYRGNDELTANNSLTNNDNQFRVLVTSSQLTFAATPVDYTGGVCTINDYTAMTAVDVGFVNIVVEVGTDGSEIFIANKVQTITKSKQGQTGNAVANVLVYRRSSSDISGSANKPTAGNYDFDNATITGLTPTTWKVDPPADDGNPMYVSQGSAVSTTGSGSSALTWSDVTKYVESVSGVNGKTATAQASDYTVQYDQNGSNPVPNTTTDVTITGSSSGFAASEQYRFRQDGGAWTAWGGNSYTYQVQASKPAAPVLIEMQVSENGAATAEASDALTIAFTQDGADSNVAGPAGNDAYTVILTNEAHTFSADNAGTVTSYVGSGTDIQVYRGNTELTGVSGTPANNDQFTISITDTGSQITEGIPNYSVITGVRIPDHSALLIDNHTLEYTITVGNPAVFTTDKIQTLSKSKEGADSTVPGPTGARGPGRFITTIATANTDWETGINQLSDSDAYTVVNNATGGNAFADDIVTFQLTGNTGSYPPTVTVICDTGGNPGAWSEITEVIDGSLLVNGTVVSDALVAESLSALKATIGTLKTAESGQRVILSSDTGEFPFAVYDDNDVAGSPSVYIDSQGVLVFGGNIPNGSITYDMLSQNVQDSIESGITSGGNTVSSGGTVNISAAQTLTTGGTPTNMSSGNTDYTRDQLLIGPLTIKDNDTVDFTVVFADSLSTSTPGSYVAPKWTLKIYSDFDSSVATTDNLCWDSGEITGISFDNIGAETGTYGFRININATPLEGYGDVGGTDPTDEVWFKLFLSHNGTTAFNAPVVSEFSASAPLTGSGTGVSTLDDLTNVSAADSANTGSILYKSAGDWVSLAAGTTGQVLKISGGVPSWGTDNNTNTNQLTTFQVEDGDGTEVTIGHADEWKFVEGQGIDVNWTDTSTGSDADPFDLTFALKANGVRATELNVTGDGVVGQYLESNADGSFTWSTPPNTTGITTINRSGNGNGGPITGTTEVTFSGGTNTTINMSGTTVTFSSTDTNTNQLTTFQVEDGDGTEVTIGHANEWKFVEGQGIDINWTDTTTGSDADPFDLTFALKADGVRATELAVTGNGTTSQYLRSDADGTFTWATPPNDNTTYSAGALLDLSGTTFAVDLSELTDMTADVDRTLDELVILDSGVQRRKLISEIDLSDFNDDIGATGAGSMDSWDLTADSGTTATIGNGGLVDIAGGTGIDTSIASNTVTVDLNFADTDLHKLRDWEPAYSNTNEDTIFWDSTEEAVALQNSSAPDTTVGMSHKAFRVSSGEQVHLSLTVKGSAADTDGVYFRVYYYNGDLPDGKTHVSNSGGVALVQEDSNGNGGSGIGVTSWHENSSINTSWTNYEFTWTVPDLSAAGGSAVDHAYASIVILNWTGYAGIIYVKDPKINIQSNHDIIPGFVANEHIDHSSVTLTAGTGLTGGGDLTANRTFALDFSELTDMTANISGTTEFILQNGTVESRKAASEIQLSHFSNNLGWTSNTGTVTSVSGGNGLTGTVTTSGSLAVGAGTGISVAADTVGIANTYSPGTATEMGASQNLDDLNAAQAGFYYQTANADTTGNNYPSGEAGSLIVQKSAGNATQMYQSYTTDPKLHIRSRYTGSWGTWQRVFADNYHPNADKWTAAITLTLGQDLSGSVDFDGSTGVTLNATVADDSHNHTIANVDNLQSSLDGKLFNSGTESFSGNLNVNATDTSGVYSTCALEMREVGLVSSSQTGDDYAPAISFHWGGRSQGKLWMQGATLNWTDGTGSGSYSDASKNIATGTFIASQDVTVGGNSVLTTATSFGGDVSGTYNAIVVADDSHNHTIANVDGLQTALDGKAALNGSLSQNFSVNTLTVDAGATITGGDVTIGTTTDSTTLVFPDKNVATNPTVAGDKRKLISMGNSAQGGLWQTTDRGGLMISSADDSLILASGDVGRGYDPDAGGWNPNPDSEDIYLLTDGSIRFWTNLQNIGTNAEESFVFDTSGIGTAIEWVATSDARLKRNIQPLTDGLETVLSLEAVTHEWIDGKPGRYNGLIAQQVKEIDPSLVTENEEGVLAVNYMKTVPVLVNAIQKLNARDKARESKLKELEDKLDIILERLG